MLKRQLQPSGNETQMNENHADVILLRGGVCCMVDEKSTATCRLNGQGRRETGEKEFLEGQGNY